MNKTCFIKGLSFVITAGNASYYVPLTYFLEYYISLEKIVDYDDKLTPHIVKLKFVNGTKVMTSLFSRCRTEVEADKIREEFQQNIEEILTSDLLAQLLKVRSGIPSTLITGDNSSSAISPPMNNI